jgi:CBS domain containing-hemolysin-like protein
MGGISSLRNRVPARITVGDRRHVTAAPTRAAALQFPVNPKFTDAASMRTSPFRTFSSFIIASVLFAAGPARASFFSGDALDAAADFIAIGVLIVVPIVVIVVFWLIHVLPERLAEKRHHPQAKAIQVLCLLSLVFGGLLWPIAWLWAFTRPVAYKMAYGTDKHEEWHEEMGEKAKAGQLLPQEFEHLAHELDSMAAKGALPANLRQLRADLAQLVAAKPAAGGNA